MTSIHFKSVATKMLLKEGLNWGESLFQCQAERHFTLYYVRLFKFSYPTYRNFVIPTYNVNGMTFCSFFFFL